MTKYFEKCLLRFCSTVFLCQKVSHPPLVVVYMNLQSSCSYLSNATHSWRDQEGSYAGFASHCSSSKRPETASSLTFLCNSHYNLKLVSGKELFLFFLWLYKLYIALWSFHHINSYIKDRVVLRVGKGHFSFKSSPTC